MLYGENIKNPCELRYHCPGNETEDLQAKVLEKDKVLLNCEERFSRMV